jgi:polyferredoxin
VGIAIASFLLTAALLSIVQLVVTEPRMLLLERFVAGGGWLEVALLSAYAAFVSSKLADEKKNRLYRPLIWRFFSVVFFAQLIIGLAGLERFLMTGALHLPVPALIVAGPIYRGSGFFMLVLFLCTIVLAGPAWCSYLCYIGSWDDLAARARRKPAGLPGYAAAMRIGIFVAVLAVAWLLRQTGAGASIAGGVAISFGLTGVGIMVFWSRRAGSMVHCTTFCPISLLANLLGKVSPFRLRIGDECDSCGTCSLACRYDALQDEDIQKRRPGLTCTLCGDCLAVCRPRQLHYRFAGLAPDRARALFLVLVVSLHAAFLGVARL